VHFTGTGKTLVALMVMSHMLTVNPHHSVVFLVDKVLLAIQQAKVIQHELGDKLFLRYDFRCINAGE
jgi:ERCC4-related helicase